MEKDKEKEGVAKLPPLKSPKKSIAVSRQSTNTHQNSKVESQKSCSSTVVKEVKVTLET